ncbi:toll/interleukin-1 receptor domain-containing protein [Leptothermofonsia sp. ETS-13]|uniref:toll/interleukin-1 receptor domain-containing protein n=1 Tax=Leptothermofonsia sp. ETS-13 TaxID=3035696 RepID=UPI003B9EC83B
MTDIFISYSRKDKGFVRKLHAALVKLGRDVWVDWEDIPPNAAWRAEIQLGIESAEIQLGIESTDTFVFVISPDSVVSRECEVELDWAIANNKRLIGSLHRETPNVHPELSKLNWVFLRESDDFQAGGAAKFAESE